MGGGVGSGECGNIILCGEAKGNTVDGGTLGVWEGDGVRRLDFVPLDGEPELLAALRQDCELAVFSPVCLVGVARRRCIC